MEIESKIFKLIKETTKETIKNKKQRKKITKTIYNNIIEDRYQSTQFYYDILINNLPEQKLNTIENTLRKNSKNFLTILTNIIYRDFFQIWKERNKNIINWEKKNNISNREKRKTIKTKPKNKIQNQNIENKSNYNIDVNISIRRWLHLGWKFNKAVCITGG